MVSKGLLTRIFASISLLAVIGQAPAREAEICAPFKDGAVDSSLLESMLSAAQKGHLYRMVQSSSQVGFCVESKVSTIEGHFRDFQGGIALKTGDHLDGQTMVLIKTASLDTDGAVINNMVKGKQFFDVEKYPEILFVSRGFEWTGSDTAVLTGDLTMRGITKPVTFDVVLTPLGGTRIGTAEKILVKATTTINRTEFGMDGLSTLVNSNVQLCLTVEALKYSSI